MNNNNYAYHAHLELYIYCVNYAHYLKNFFFFFEEFQISNKDVPCTIYIPIYMIKVILLQNLLEYLYISSLIQTSMVSFDSWSISHIYREANKVADWIANVDHLVSSFVSIDICNYSALHNTIVNDVLGISLVWRVP